MKKTMIILLVLLCSLSVFLFAEENSTQIQKEESSREEITVIVGESDSLYGAIPVVYCFEASLCEQIYYADELNISGVALKAMDFFYNFSVIPEVTDLNIWVGETTKTELLESDGYITPDQLTQVFSGPVKYKLGKGVANIQFEQPYAYAGGNLVVLTQRLFDVNTYSSDDTQFYYAEDEAHPKRTMWTINWKGEIDPYNPDLGYTVNEDRMAKCKFYFESGEIGSITGTITDDGTPIADVELAIEGTSSKPTTDSLGVYTFPCVTVGTHDVGARKLGYEDATVTGVVVVADSMSVADIVMIPLPVLNVTGKVMGSDAPQTGMEGVTVTLAGYNGYEVATVADGGFTVEGVYGDNTYDVEIKKKGYGTYVATAELLDLNLDLGTIILEESIKSPANVVATLNEDCSEVALTWDIPGTPEPHELVQHDGNIHFGNLQPTGWGFGVVYDLSGYDDVTVEMVDFYHIAHEVFGIWDYKIHIIDWDTQTELNVIKGLQTTGDDKWEVGIKLGSIATDGLVGIFLEPLGHTSNDAHPVLCMDPSLNGTSYQLYLNDYSAKVPAYGDFLMDLWVMGGEKDKLMKAQRVSVNANETRSLLSYNVYRFKKEDQNNSEAWDLLATVTETNYTDTGFATLEGGFYGYAVTANYTDDLESEAKMSNEVEKVVVSADGIYVSAVTRLVNNYPNPFNPTTSISFSIAKDANVELTIYNAKGQKVKTLLNESLKVGDHSVTWNGEGDNGKSVSSGIYFYKMSAGSYSAMKKMLLMK